MTDIKTAASTAVELFRRDLIATLQANVAANRRTLQALRSAMLGQGYVVRSTAGITLAFDVDAQGHVTNPTPAAPALATRFTLADATMVAQACGDGTGKPLEVVHVLVALADAIKDDEAVVAELQAGAKPSQV